MAVDVYAWPPVYTTAQYLTPSRPGQSSLGLSGTAAHSQAAPTRRMWNATVSATAKDGNAHGYIEVLKILMDGKLPLVRVRPLPRHYRRVRGGAPTLGKRDLSWTSSGDPLGWTTSGSDLGWTVGSEVSATTGSDDWQYIDCTGLPASRLVAAPGEMIEASNGATAHVLRPATSDASGNARIYLTSAIPTGTVLIGVRESIALRIVDFPTSSQTLEAYSYQFEMVEAFSTEYSGGFTELDPWS